MNLFREKYPPFLGSETGNVPPGKALFHVIPVPFEKSVSYGTGTRRGPSAILRASQQLELFDGHSVPAENGIHTTGPVRCSGPSAGVLDRITRACSAALAHSAIPVILGGEHSVTCGVMPAFTGRGIQFGVVQFDAHADLRDSYEGDRYSHASAMKRVVDLGIPLFQIGIRSLSPGEQEFRKSLPVPGIDAEDLFKNGLPAKVLPDDFPGDIYVTFDIDALSPSLVPATGTPEPGGLDWYTAMALVERICAEREIIGFDLVELAPQKNHHASDFTAARLIYNTMGMISRKHAL